MMKHLSPRLVFGTIVALLCPILNAAANDVPRLLVLTDIGGDPDDQQSMVRLMVYSNQFEIEGLIASSSGSMGRMTDHTPRTDLLHEIVDAYGLARPNLQRFESGWPLASSLHAVIKAGNPDRGREHIGEGSDTEGSRWLVERIDAGTPQRPLNISIWGGQSDLAQALWRVKTERGPDGLAYFVQKFRVYDIADQDEIASWMRDEFPGMTYILTAHRPDDDKRSATFRGMYLTGNESLTSRDWIEAHVRSTSPLGALYPTKTWTDPNPHACMKEGDTPAWFFFLRLGGNDPADPTQPGWGGRYELGDDGWYHGLAASTTDRRTTISDWRPEFQADFAQRMRWTID